MHAPSLDARREDIPLLVRDIVLKLAAESPSAAARAFVARNDPTFVIALLRQHDLANIHELRRWVIASIAENGETGVLRIPMKDWTLMMEEETQARRASVHAHEGSLSHRGGWPCRSRASARPEPLSSQADGG